MRLGLLADIHEHVDLLQIALDRFRSERVDCVIVLGDVYQSGEALDETCRLLAEANAIGVWGNHDFGLCGDDADENPRFSRDSLRFLRSLLPRLALGDCHFMHVEPWLNPEDISDLWYFEGPPDVTGTLPRIFDATPHRILFSGHYHKWLLATPDGIADWVGHRTVILDSGRRFVTVGALCERRYATFNTTTSELRPYNER
jgi:hypothetical protein